MNDINKIMSNRLKMISNSVRNSNLVYDIGTDHAYVPIDLLQKNIAKKATATDIRTGPIKNAKKNIKKYKFEDEIKTKIGNGLDVIDDNPDCIIIAGMGGILITQLIENNIDKAKKVKQLIIQAMNNEELVREYMLNKGFKIEFEKLTKDINRIYNLISFNYCNYKNDYEGYEFYTSKYLLQKNDKLLKEYLIPKAKRLNAIIKGQSLNNQINDDLVVIKKKVEEIIYGN